MSNSPFGNSNVPVSFGSSGPGNGSSFRLGRQRDDGLSLRCFDGRDGIGAADVHGVEFHAVAHLHLVQ